MKNLKLKKNLLQINKKDNNLVYKKIFLNKIMFKKIYQQEEIDLLKL